MRARDLSGPAAVILAALFLLVSSGSTSAAPPPFDPGGVMCFENLESGAECDGDTSPGAAADLRTKLCVGWNDDCSVRDAVVTDSNFGDAVTFTPATWNLPAGNTIPIGALAGRLESEAWLGLLNNPCNNRVQVGFTLMNASVNVSDTISPRPEGQTDPMQPLAQDVSPANGIPDGADRYPSFLAEFFASAGTPIQPRARLFGISNIQGGWISLNFVFFEPGTTLLVAGTPMHFSPALGYPSVTVLQNPTAQNSPGAITDFCAPIYTANITLGKTINNPCTPVKVVGANCPISSDTAPEFVSSGGAPYPSFPCDPRSKFDDDGDGKINDGCPQVNATPESGAQCDNDVSDDPEDSSVNDGCPSFGDVSEGARIPGVCAGGDEGGCTYRANPAAAGAVDFHALITSQRDADGDGVENALDVCALILNPEWNPRAVDPLDDADSDGLPNVCDPSPNVTSPGSPGGCKSGYTGSDHDQDCFSNRADNCPTVTQLLNPALPPDNFTNTNPPLEPDADADRIGDACDQHVSTADGSFAVVCLKFTLDVGGAAVPETGVKSSDCFTAGDADCDGGVDAVDALHVLRSIAGLPTSASCTAGGNVKCDDGLTATDALFILRHVAGLPVVLPQGCKVIGT